MRAVRRRIDQRRTAPSRGSCETTHGEIEVSFIQGDNAPPKKPEEIVPDLAAEVAALRAAVRELLAASTGLVVDVADSDLVGVNHRQKILADARNRAATLVQEARGET